MGISRSHDIIWKEEGDRSRYTTDDVSYILPGLKKFASGMEPRDFKVIDIGCGPGLACERLAKEGFDVYGTDISPEAVRLCKKKLSNYPALRRNVKERILVHDMHKPFPFPSEYFDAGTAFSVLHHNSPEQLDGTLKRIYRILKENGKFYASVLDGKNFEEAGETDPKFGELYTGPGGGIWGRKDKLYYPIYDSKADMNAGRLTMERKVSQSQPGKFIPVYHILFDERLIEESFGKYFKIIDSVSDPKTKGILLLIDMNRR